MTVRPTTLPPLDQVPTRAFSSRHGIVPTIVTLHRWSGGTLPGVESWFENPADDASSHFVYAGEVGTFAGRCVQMVRLADKAWTQAAWNPHCVSIECADAMWLGHDPAGLLRTARIAAYLLHKLKVPPTWCHGAQLLHEPRGICRHADLGALGGGHTSCPTTSTAVWRGFVEHVAHEYARGGFRSTWAV